MNRKVLDNQARRARLMAHRLHARVSGGNPRKRSGKTPLGPTWCCANLRALRGFKTMHRYAHAPFFLSLAGTLGPALVPLSLTRNSGGTAPC
jgi:hypothetical protein